jgi:hypothetical protein
VVKADAIAQWEPLVSLPLEAALVARRLVAPQYAKLRTPEASQSADSPNA